VTRLRCGGIRNDHRIENVLLSVSVKVDSTFYPCLCGYSRRFAGEGRQNDSMGLSRTAIFSISLAISSETYLRQGQHYYIATRSPSSAL